MGMLRFLVAQVQREVNGAPFGAGPPLLVTTSVLMHGASAWALLAGPVPGGYELGLFAGSFALRMFGITAGYHRYFAHGSYQTSRAFQFALAMMGASAWQKGPLWWASHHTEHHLHSDQPEDVHSPVHGSLLWAHMGWFWGSMEFDSHPRAYQEGRGRVAKFRRYPELVALDKFHHAPGIALALTAYTCGGGLPGLLWGFVLPTVGAWHATFAVNSACHVWGSRRFATSDNSRNNLWVAIATFGEGNHNNHHAFPWSARHGLTWCAPVPAALLPCPPNSHRREAVVGRRAALMMPAPRRVSQARARPELRSAAAAREMWRRVGPEGADRRAD